MFERYDTEPYRFIPPFRGKLWCRVARRIIPRHLRQKMKVVSWEFAGLEHLADSAKRGAGVLLTPNHCRWADPMVLGMMGTGCDLYLYYVASYHLFTQSKVTGWILNRIGGYSIWREGSDRESLRASSEILAAAERPVVIFPEGTWFRQNDRVGPLQEGLSLIVRQAIKQSERPIHVHPVGLKYWMLQDPRPELGRRLGRLERRLGWHPQEPVDLIGRIEKLGGAFLALKEIEHFGEAQPGTIDDRIPRLVMAHVVAKEQQFFGKTFDGWALERIRRLRQLLVRKLPEVKPDLAAFTAVRQALSDLLFCENLNAHSLDYLRSEPSHERLTETVQRIEETVSDEVESPVTPMGVTGVIGPAIDARELYAARGRSDPLVARLRDDIQRLVDRLREQGPPARWNCPAQPAPAH